MCILGTCITSQWSSMVYVKFLMSVLSIVASFSDGSWHKASLQNEIINVQKYSNYTKFVLMILYDLYPFVWFLEENITLNVWEFLKRLICITRLKKQVYFYKLTESMSTQNRSITASSTCTQTLPITWRVCMSQDVTGSQF